MKKGHYILLAVILVIIIAVSWFVGKYNLIQKQKPLVEEAWAQVENVYQSRLDLIPNLVETVKSYMQHERETLEAVIQARNAATAAREQASPADGGSMQSLANAESGLGGALGRLFALSENYPELRSNQNMLQLQEELTSTESKVAFSRQAYNDAVMHFNNKIEMFPSNIIAGLFRFVPATSFEVSDDSERENVVVKF